MMRRHFHAYAPPGKDSPRAVANAVMFLTSARDIGHISAEGFAHQYRLSLKRADYMLTVAKQRRAADAL